MVNFILETLFTIFAAIIWGGILCVLICGVSSMLSDRETKRQEELMKYDHLFEKDNQSM